MAEKYDLPDLKLTFDETRLVRLFRCLSQEDRSSLLHDIHIQLMRIHTITNKVGRYANPEEVYRDELAEELPDRLPSAKPYQTLIADAHNLDISFGDNPWGCDYAECLLGTEEWQPDSFVDDLVYAYVESVDSLGFDPCIDLRSDDDFRFAREEAREYLRFWRANIVCGIEDSVAFKSSDQ